MTKFHLTNTSGHTKAILPLFLFSYPTTSVFDILFGCSPWTIFSKETSTSYPGLFPGRWGKSHGDEVEECKMQQYTLFLTNRKTPVKPEKIKIRYLFLLHERFRFSTLMRMARSPHSVFVYKPNCYRGRDTLNSQFLSFHEYCCQGNPISRILYN